MSEENSKPEFTKDDNPNRQLNLLAVDMVQGILYQTKDVSTAQAMFLSSMELVQRLWHEVNNAANGLGPDDSCGGGGCHDAYISNIAYSVALALENDVASVSQVMNTALAFVAGVGLAFEASPERVPEDNTFEQLQFEFQSRAAHKVEALVESYQQFRTLERTSRADAIPEEELQRVVEDFLNGAG